MANSQYILKHSWSYNVSWDAFFINETLAWKGNENVIFTGSLLLFCPPLHPAAPKILLITAKESSFAPCLHVNATEMVSEDWLKANDWLECNF